jgi:tetratricopeptide (TPR) repeat protein
MEGLLVRDDPESILAYRQAEATLREVAALSAYRLEELREHKKAVGAYPAPLLSLGEALEKNGDREAAAEEYREILAGNPCSLWGHLRLGNLLEAAGKLDAAAAHYRSAARAVPRYHLPHSLLGSALRKMGRPGEARSEYARALELYPHDRLARRGLGLIRQGGPSPSIRTYRRRPSTGLTASPHWPAFLQHPIPDGQRLRRASEP